MYIYRDHDAIRLLENAKYENCTSIFMISKNVSMNKIELKRWRVMIEEK